MSKKIIKQIDVNGEAHYIASDTENIYDRSGKTQEEINMMLLSKLMEHDNLLKSSVKEYGLEVDFENETFTRLGDASTFPMDLTAQSASNPFDTIAPWGDMTRCTVTDTKSVILYGEEGYTEDGSVGQVMVRIPKFYYKVEPIKFEANPNGATGKQALKLRYWVCMSKKQGYKTHPAFFDKWGMEVPYLYFSAYEGSVWNKSTGFYNLTDAQDTNFTTDILCSIKGAKPCSGLTQNLTIENARKLANNRGEGWEQQDFTSVSAIQLLLMMEYASTDSQGKVGQGVVSIADVSTDNCSLITGGTSTLGNKSGYVGVNGKSSVNYRGIENFWGNIWKFVDGFNIEAKGIHQGWIADRNGNYKCNTKLGHSKTPNISKENGYVDRIGYVEECDYGFIPTRSTGSSSKPMNDYLYQNYSYNGFLIALLGGFWADGAAAGCFCWLVNNAASLRGRGISARLACR